MCKLTVAEESNLCRWKDENSINRYKSLKRKYSMGSELQTLYLKRNVKVPQVGRILEAGGHLSYAEEASDLFVQLLRSSRPTANTQIHRTIALISKQNTTDTVTFFKVLST